MQKKLRFIIGPHGGGKSKFIFDRMVHESFDENHNFDFNKKIYLIVPEQDTKEKQKQFLENNLNLSNGMLNCDVISFDRLSYMVFSKLFLNDYILENTIQDDMKALICQMAMERCKKELKVFGSKIGKIGFAEKIASVMSEFTNFKIDENKLNVVINNINNYDLIKNEIKDLSLIQKNFMLLLDKMKLITGEDKIKLLCDKLDEVSFFDNSVVFFDGFTGFSPVQRDIFEKIKKRSKTVYVAIDYRKEEFKKYFYDYLNHKQVDNIEKYYDNNIFHISSLFVESLSGNEIDDNSIIWVDKGLDIKYENKQDLKYLEENIFKINDFSENVLQPDNIKLNSFKNIDNEVEYLCHKIIELSKIEKEIVRYNDIKVVVPNISDYKDIIISKFNKYNIPLFIDDSQTVFTSLYVKAIRTFISICANDFSYDTVMAYLNSGVFDLEYKNDNIDLHNTSQYSFNKIYYFDNAIRRYGVNGYKSFDINGFYYTELTKQDDDSLYHTDIYIHRKQMIDIYNNYILPLVNIYKKLINNNKDITLSLKDFVFLLKQFIESIKLDSLFDIYLENIKKIKYEKLSNKDLVMLEKSKDCVDRILFLLDKIGNNDEDDYKYNLIQLSQIFDNAIDIFKVKSIPFSMDQIVVGDLMRSRFDNPKVLFFLGMNDSALPCRQNDDNILNDRIRDIFRENNIELSQKIKETVYNSRFYTYLTLTNPTSKLYLSYTKKNSNRENDFKSKFLLDIEELFFAKNEEGQYESKLKEENIDIYNLQIYAEKQMRDFISIYNSDNNKVVRYYKKNNDDKSDNEKLQIKNAITSKIYYDILKQREKTRNENSEIENNKIYNDIEFKNHKNIKNGLINKLCGKKFEISPTAIEMFSKCPYKFFLEKTLGLKERKNNKITNIDIGNIFHNVIELYFTEMFKNKNKKNFFDDFLNEIDDVIIVELKNSGKYNETNTQKFLINRLKTIITRTIESVNEQLENHAPIIDIKQEYKFGNYKLGDTDNYIKGRIDHIEFVTDIENPKVLYVKVVDFKSSKKRIRQEDVDSGVLIQFVVYLDCVLNMLNTKGSSLNEEYKSYDKIIPLGTFYKTIGDSIVNVTETNFEEFEKNYENLNKGKILKLYVEEAKKENMKMTGILNADEYKLIDKDGYIETKNKGGYNFSKCKFNSFMVENSIALKNTDEINLLCNKVKELIKKSMNDIKDGRVVAKPVGRICEYCSFFGTCKNSKIIDDEVSDE